MGFPRGRRSQRAAGGTPLRSAAVSASCIYVGTIRHRRFDPRREFNHRLALAYLDLDELPKLFDGRLIARRSGLVRFRRCDYLGDPAVPLRRAVRDVVEDQTGARPEGPIRLLTQLRSFGHCFNPVSFYYCFEPGGERVQALVAEVTNTPWGTGTPTWSRATSATQRCSLVSSTRRSTSRRSWAWIIATTLGRGCPPGRCRSTSPGGVPASPCSTRRWRCAAGS